MAELQDQEDNLLKRYEQKANNGNRKELEQINIKIYKESIKQQDGVLRSHGDDRNYELVKEVHFDGLCDFVFCSNDINTLKEYVAQTDVLQAYVMQDDPKETQTKGLEFRMVYKRESVFLISQPFDYQYSNGLFIKLYEGEQYPLVPSSVIQIGSKIQFIMEKYHTGIIAAPGRRSSMEDSFVIIQDLAIHP